MGKIECPMCHHKHDVRDGLLPSKKGLRNLKNTLESLQGIIEKTIDELEGAEQ